MEQRKTVSIVIPVFNREVKIIRALDSVRNQTYLNRICEIIVVDDGSSDQSRQAVRNYLAKYPFLPIHLLYQENQGASAARNRGMAVSTGDYLAFLDSDDEWTVNKLEIQMKLLEQNSDIDFLGGGDNDTPLKILFKKKPQLYRATLTDLLLKSFPVTPSIIFKRNIYAEIGGFDETITHYEDCDYLQRICIAGYGYYYFAKKVVTCDGGKPSFGASGLSANLSKIHHDCIVSLKKIRSMAPISTGFYLFLRLFYFAKHLRRVVLSKQRGGKASK